MSTSAKETWASALAHETHTSDKSWTKAVCLSLVLGPFGVDRFYLGFGVLGLLKLCTVGFGGLWGFADILLLVAGQTKDAEGRRLARPFGK